MFALFDHFRIFGFEQQTHEPTGLLGPGCALTDVDIYTSHTLALTGNVDFIISDYIHVCDIL